MKNRIICVAMMLILLLAACQKEVREPKEFVFGMIMVGPYNDHGWSEAHYSAGKYVEEKVPDSRMVYLDKLNPADRPETTLEQAVDDMVAEGARLIFTTSDDFQIDTDVAAHKYPDVRFIMVSGDHAKTGEAPPNVGNYMGKMEYMKAVAGCAAALNTETGVIGYLGPLVNDETRRLVASAYLGARHCYTGDEPMRFIVKWIGFWFHLPGITGDPTLMANDIFNEGADVILSGIDTTEALVVTRQRAEAGKSVLAIPYDYEDACDEAPDVCLGVPYFNWAPGYVEITNQVIAGTWKQHWTWAGYEDRAVGWTHGSALSKEDRATVDKLIEDMIAGNIVMFEGPLNWQDGSTYLTDGEIATDDQVWYFPGLLQGMEGLSE